MSQEWSEEFISSFANSVSFHWLPFSTRTILQTKQLGLCKRISAIDSVQLYYSCCCCGCFCCYIFVNLQRKLYGTFSLSSLSFFLLLQNFRLLAFYDAAWFCIIFKLYIHSIDLHLIFYHFSASICFFFSNIIDTVHVIQLADLALKWLNMYWAVHQRTRKAHYRTWNLAYVAWNSMKMIR